MHIRKILPTLIGGKVAAGAAVPPWWLAGGSIATNQVWGAYRAIGAASLAASYVNLNNPGTNDLTTTHPPDWDSTNGWGFTGTQILLTNLYLSQTTIFGTFIRYTNAGSDNGAGEGRYIFGASGPIGSINTYPLDTNGKAMAETGAGQKKTFSGGLVAGVLGFTPTGLYMNGTKIGTLIDARGAGTDTNPCGLGGFNHVYANWALFTGNIQACVILTIDPTPGQVSDLTTYMQNLT